MSLEQQIFIGTDGGATMSKVAAVLRDGTPVTTDLLQWPTNAQAGRQAIVQGWVDAITAYLGMNGLHRDQVHGAGLSIPGPFRSYGVFDRPANLPASFAGFDVLTALSNALSTRQAGPYHWWSATTAIWRVWPKRSACAGRG